MVEWLTKITITCFAASYLVTLLLEVSRLFFRAPIRLAVMLAFALAGLFAHTAHLIVEAREGTDYGVPLSRWYDWCLIAAWVLAAIYAVYTIRRPKSVAGLFLLPVVLILIVMAQFFFGPTYPDEKLAILRMGQIHGMGLLAGTVLVILGFVAGVMYLAQAHRLKHKLPRREGLKLPSLEWLQRVNRRAFSLSSIFIAGGLIAGVILNLIKHRVPWTEPLVIMSGILLLWLIVAMLFEYLYKPAREGRKVAYLTIASFIFLALVLSTVIFDITPSHGPARQGDAQSNVRRIAAPPSLRTLDLVTRNASFEVVASPPSCARWNDDFHYPRKTMIVSGESYDQPQGASPRLRSRQPPKKPGASALRLTRSTARSLADASGYDSRHDNRTSTGRMLGRRG